MAIKRKMTRDAVRGDFFTPDSDCLPRFNYSNGAGWRTNNRGHIRWDSRTTNKGKVRRCHR